MSETPERLALASIVLRVGRIRSSDDLLRLRVQIEGERDRWHEVVRTRTEQLHALDALSVSPEATDA